MTIAKPVTLALAALAILAAPAMAVNNLRISQLYGGGGNSGANFNADFVELYNAGSSSASLAGFSVQYASAGGTSWSVATLSGSIAAGGYYLVRMNTAGVTGAALPGTDAVASPVINMSATAGKLALVNVTAALSGSCPTGSQIVDFVGYGSTATCSETAVAPGPSSSNTQSDARKSSFTLKNIDTDNNSTDFIATTTCPRWSGSSGDPCGPTSTRGSAWGTLKSLYR